MNKTPAHRQLRDGGFSLLEFIVALALLALLMAILPPAVRMAKRASAFAVQLTNTSGTATSMVAVERLLREAAPQIERDETGALKIAFDGQNTSLSFVAPVSDGPHGACLCRFTVATTQNETNARRDVVLTSQPWIGSSGGAQGKTDSSPIKRTLTIAAGDVSFRYFGIAPKEQVPQWHGAWPRRDRLPDLVEITLPRETRSGLQPVPVVVELMLRRR